MHSLEQGKLRTLYPFQGHRVIASRDAAWQSFSAAIKCTPVGSLAAKRGAEASAVKMPSRP